MIMKTFLSSANRARLLAIVLGLGCAPAVLAQSLPFAGRWLLEDHPDPQAPDAVLTINGSNLAWSAKKGAAPTCVQPFVLKNEAPGTVYTDGHGTKFVAGVPGSIPTYLLKVGASTCGSLEEEVRIRYPLIYDVGHIEVIEYVKGKPVSSRRFRRKK